jgi:hypothetical protein
MEFHWKHTHMVLWEQNNLTRLEKSEKASKKENWNFPHLVYFIYSLLSQLDIHAAQQTGIHKFLSFSLFWLFFPFLNSYCIIVVWCYLVSYRMWPKLIQTLLFLHISEGCVEKLDSGWNQRGLKESIGREIKPQKSSSGKEQDILESQWDRD